MTWFYSSDLPVLPASPGRGPPSVTSKFGISVQLAAPASPDKFLYECSKKLMLSNSCTFIVFVHIIVNIIFS